MQISPRFTGPAFIGTNPQLNWQSPVINGLKGVWLPGIAQWNLVDAAFLSPQGTGFNTSAGQFGGDCFFGGANTSQGYKSLGPPYLSNSGGVNWTIMFFAAFNTGTPGGGINGAGAWCERAASGNDIIKVGYTHSGGDIIQLTLRNDAGTLLQINDPTDPRDLIYRTWVATKKGNGGSGNVILYRNAVVVATGNWTGTDSYTDAGLTGTVGYDIADNSGNLFAHLVLAAVWTRVLSPVEISSVSLDPFSFLLFNENYVGATLSGVKIVAGGAVFRRTLSSIGTRTGSRQGVMQ